MSESSLNRPAYKAKAGSIELTAWANESDDGLVNHVTYLTRSYRLPPEKRDGADDDGWRKTNSLRKGDLLAAAEMLRLAHLRISVLEVINRLNATED